MLSGITKTKQICCRSELTSAAENAKLNSKNGNSKNEDDFSQMKEGK